MEIKLNSIKFSNSGISELCDFEVQERFEAVITKISNYLFPDLDMNWSYEQPAQQIYFVKPSLNHDQLESLKLGERDLGLACSLAAIGHVRTFLGDNVVLDDDVDFAMYEIERGIQGIIFNQENAHVITEIIYNLTSVINRF